MAVNGSAQSASRAQEIRGIIQSLVTSTFSGTLGTEKDIVNICMAICQQESTMGQRLQGLYLGTPGDSSAPNLIITNSSGARDYWQSSPVQALVSTASAAQRQNLKDGLCAWGVMQVMGWNLVRNASKRAKRQDLQGTPADSIMVNAGESISAVLGGQNNFRNQILAGLSILEAKWKISRRLSSGQWQIGNITYNNQISCAVRGYIGLSDFDLGTGLRSSTYVENVIGGKYYQIANNGATSNVNTAVANTSSPPATIASTGTAVVPGCTTS